MVANMAPVLLNGSIKGIIISIEEMEKLEKNYSELYNNIYANTFSASGSFEHLVANSKTMATAVRQARIYSQYDTPILITGEIGSGKKNLAQCIHNESTRRDNPFVALDCSTISPESLDHLLYGIDNGNQKNVGLMRIANNGTLYLGNVCVFDMYAQKKLAGVLSDNTYYDPITGHKVALPSRVRLICASRQNIDALVANGEFSPALYCALQTLTLHVPSLRERKEDIWDLALQYVSEFSSRHKKFVHLEEDVLKVLCGFSWPGNTYQFSKYCERLVVLTQEGTIDANMAEQLLPIWGELSAFDTASSNNEEEHDRILHALKIYGGNRNDVAIELGISKTTLWRRMKYYQIQWQ